MTAEEHDLNEHLRKLDETVERRARETRYRLDRRSDARGRHLLSRAHPDVVQPTDKDLGEVLAQLRARCGACGRRAQGQFARHERGTVWEHGGDRWWLEHVWASNYLCRDHGVLAYERDSLEADLDAAAQRPDGTKVLRLPPGPARPPSRRGVAR